MYVLHAVSAAGWFDVLCNRATIAHFTREKFSDLRVPIPAVDEQRAIVAFLDRETARIDALIEKKQRQIELLEEKRTALISHAVTKGLNSDVNMKDSGIEWLGEIPEHWDTSRIANIASKITNGYVGPTRDILVDNGVPYLQSLHIKDNSIKFDARYFVTEEWSQLHRKSILREGDVLVVQTGDIGQVSVVRKDYEGANCHALIIITCRNEHVIGRFLSLVLNSTYGFHSLRSIQTGALHPHLNCTYVREILIPVPPVAEQERIVDHVRAIQEQIMLMSTKVRDSITLLRE
jgi:type I restriction enzyme S subunit